jgi:hypothetical protein
MMQAARSRRDLSGISGFDIILEVKRFKGYFTTEENR